MNGSQVTIDNVRRVFDTGLIAVDGVSLTVPAGQFIAILGPSGSGKSTLLRMIAGLDRPTDGAIAINQGERSVVDYAGPAGKPDLAYVFQDAHLLPWRRVLANVTLPLELTGTPRDQRREEALAAIAMVGLSGFERSYPSQLSGGMRMRVSLARAIVTQPRLLLLDEPFAALDEITRHQLDMQLRDLWQRTGMTVIFVTHSIMEATFLAERAIVVSRRPAKVVLDHPIALPANRGVAIRGTADFAREMGTLMTALSAGSEPARA
jgi:NitT/TauT family transport system ATP-binding protein